MKISIVTITYNCVDTIECTLQSVVSQDCGDNNWEYIVIDGGSNDGTIEVLKKYDSTFSYFISESDKGIYDAMNKAIGVASGEWIIFMNAGDCFVNEHTISDIMQSTFDKNVDVIYGDAVAKYPWGKILLPARFFSEHDINLPFCHQSTLVRTNLMKERKFDLKYKIAADYNFFYSLFKEKRIFQYITMPIAIYDAIGFSTSRVLETYMEVAKIRNANHGVKYLLKLTSFWLRKQLIGMIPHSIVDSYRKNKYTVINTFF